MSWFKSKNPQVRPATCYIVYFNRPSENNDGSFYQYQSSKIAEEYATLEEAQRSAKSWAKYYKVYITKAEPIWEYESKIVEFQV